MPSEPGLIEFLVPDERAFGPAEGGSLGGSGAGTAFVGFDGDLWDDQPERSPRSRWLSILTGIAVTGLMVSGVVAAAPWAADDAAVTLPTVAEQTPSIPTTLGAIPDAPVDPSLTGWVLDPVATGMRPTYLARSVDLRRDDFSWGEVWASPGATRASGRWFSLTLQPFVEFSPGRPELWFPVDVAGRPGHARVAGDGVVSLSFDLGQTNSSRLVNIDAFGIGLDAMVALADSISIIDDRPQMVDDRPEFTRPELLEGLDRIAAAPTDMDLTASAIAGGTRRTVALYTGPGPFDVTLVQEQTPDLTSDGGDITALMPLAFTSVPLADGWGPKGDFAGEDLVVGFRTFDDLDITIARWLDGETEVSLLTTGDLGDLLRMLPDVELASAEDWAAAERSLNTGSREDEPLPRTPPGITVDVTAADGTVVHRFAPWDPEPENWPALGSGVDG